MAEAEPTAFGALLRQHRHAAGPSRETLAGRAGLSVQAIMAPERGERRAPYRDTVRRLGVALNQAAGDRATLAAAATYFRSSARVADPERIEPTNLPRVVHSTWCSNSA